MNTEKIKLGTFDQVQIILLSIIGNSNHIISPVFQDALSVLKEENFLKDYFCDTVITINKEEFVSCVENDLSKPPPLFEDVCGTYWPTDLFFESCKNIRKKITLDENERVASAINFLHSELERRGLFKSRGYKVSSPKEPNLIHA